MVAAVGTFTGLYWRSARTADAVRVESLQIDAAVQADGSALVTETLAFDPSHLHVEELTRRIPTADDAAVVFRDATDDAGRPVTAIARVESDGTVAVRVHAMGRSMIVLRYAVSGAVRDGGVVAMQWLDTSNPLAIGDLTASISWHDGGVPASAAQGFVDGRRLADERLGAGVRFHASPVPAHAHAAGAVAFGSDAAAIEAELARLASPPDQAATVPWNAIGLAAGLTVLADWALLHRLRGRQYPVPAVMGETSPPSDHTPAEVGWLLRFGVIRHGDLTATLIHLASRGYLIPYRRDDRLVLGPGRPPEGLHSHELLVFDWLFPGITRECDLEARNAEIRQAPERWAAMWETFVDEVRAVGRSSSLVEREAESPVVVGLGFAGLSVVALGVAGLAASYPGWIACILAGAFVLAASTAFARLSPEGALLAARWEAFGRSLAEAPDAGPEALAYAVVLHEQDAAAAVLDAHGARATPTPWPTQLMDREVQVHVDRWRMSYLVATSVKGEPSERLRAVLSLRALRRRTDATAAGPG